MLGVGGYYEEEVDSVHWTPVRREEGEEEEDGGEQVGPANHPGHLVDIAVSRIVLTMTILTASVWTGWTAKRRAATREGPGRTLRQLLWIFRFCGNFELSNKSTVLYL